MRRRAFIKSSCSACILIGAGVFIETLSGCTAASVYKTGIIDKKISVPLSLFADKWLQIIRVETLEYDIAVRKVSDNNYSAILMRCSHADNQLVQSSSGFYCNLHGSKFSESGQVLKGPAELPLHQFNVSVISENIILTI